jgi:DNA invertase Pin-like site-specific DNA recombinase
MAGTSLRAVAYYRMSTDRQEASIPDQREAVEKLARQKGYTIAREYKDEGISGDDTERRADFRRMLDDATRLGDFDAVLCWDQDRFGRFDPLEAGYWIKPLRDQGIYLETVSQGKIDWEDFAGRIIYSVTQEGKNAYLRDLSRNVTRGQLAKAKRGEWLGGKPPYGYRLSEHKRLEPGDPQEIETVRWLFTAYAERDTSLRALAIALNDRGVPAPGRQVDAAGRLKLWCPDTVRKIITRPAYLGHSVWNRRHDGKYHEVRGGNIHKSERRRGAKGNDPADWVWVENTHEPLIDRALFDRVQQRLTARRARTTPAVGAGQYLFTGLLRCAHCGWPMHGYPCSHKAKDGTTRRYRRYICGNYNLHGRGAGGCRCNTVMEHQLLTVLVIAIQAEFLKPANLRALKAEIRRQEEAEQAGREQPAAALGRHIAELESKIKTGTERWLTAPPSLTGVLGETLEQWRRECEDLKAKRRKLDKPAPSAADLDAAAEKIAAGLTVLRERIGEADPAEIREVIRGMVERIVLRFRLVPYGRRERSVLDHGVIHLRPDLVNAAVPIVEERDPARGVNRSPYGFGGPVGAGGALFALADGSVRFVSERTSPAVLRALATPDGGEPIDTGVLELPR